jgi:4a-hydroxytetrahydrobiopterin dehydratase
MNQTSGRLAAAEIQESLGRIGGWELQGDSITRTYEFPSFRSSLAFVAWVGELAEARDHHPDIDIRYSKVQLVLSTHSAGGLTEKDFDLAALIDQR